MPWSVGINFRATSGYVTDGTGQTYCIGDAYPVTRTPAGGSSGVTFGYTTTTLGGATRDRSTGVDVRLAGINYAGLGTPTQTFEIDLPASGTYSFGCALGDWAASNQTTPQIKVCDGSTSTVLTTIGDGTTLISGYMDAAGTVWQNAAWPGSNQAISLTFATATCLIQVLASSSYTAVAHLYLTQTGGGAAARVPGPFPSLPGGILAQ